jgi:hypothetical protein
VNFVTGTATVLWCVCVCVCACVCVCVCVCARATKPERQPRLGTRSDPPPLVPHAWLAHLPHTLAGDSVTLELEPAKGGDKSSMTVDVVLVSAGARTRACLRVVLWVCALARVAPPGAPPPESVHTARHPHTRTHMWPNPRPPHALAHIAHKPALHMCIAHNPACAAHVHTRWHAGRRPYATGLGLENVGITPNKRGQIEVDEHFRTSVPSIYAIGDVIPGACCVCCVCCVVLCCVVWCALCCVVCAVLVCRRAVWVCGCVSRLALRPVYVDVCAHVHVLCVGTLCVPWCV